jgi:hypothetical protein
VLDPSQSLWDPSPFAVDTYSSPTTARLCACVTHGSPARSALPRCPRLEAALATREHELADTKERLVTLEIRQAEMYGAEGVAMDTAEARAKAKEEAAAAKAAAAAAAVLRRWAIVKAVASAAALRESNKLSSLVESVGASRRPVGRLLTLTQMRADNVPAADVLAKRSSHGSNRACTRCRCAATRTYGERAWMQDVRETQMPARCSKHTARTHGVTVSHG